MLRAFVLRAPAHYQALQAFLQANYEACAKDGKPLAVEVHLESSKRSIQANRLYWALLHQIAEQAWMDGRQYSADIFHEYLKRHFLGCVDLPKGGTMGISTATLSVGEFAEYMTRVEAWATSELGVQFTELDQPGGRMR